VNISTIFDESKEALTQKQLAINTPWFQAVPFLSSRKKEDAA